jgi:hypothetical protein
MMFIISKLLVFVCRKNTSFMIEQTEATNFRKINLISSALFLEGKGQNVKNQSVKSPKVDQKFEKDQNVKNHIRLLMF